jgi:hypothetical protein
MRSYLIWDSMGGPIPAIKSIVLNSCRGTIHTCLYYPSSQAPISEWYHSRIDPNDNQNKAEWAKDINNSKSGFSFKSYARAGVSISAPLWFPLLVIAALAVAPWNPKLWKFSLRTLLIATTLIAVVLGLVVWRL